MAAAASAAAPARQGLDLDARGMPSFFGGSRSVSLGPSAELPLEPFEGGAHQRTPEMQALIDEKLALQQRMHELEKKLLEK
tara:strand:- start:244 stop:486 length:243 start_codon:yes stop_codon:yes gene_type:complete